MVPWFLMVYLGLVLDTCWLLVDFIDDFPQHSIRLRLEDYVVVPVHEEGDELVGSQEVDRLEMGFEFLVFCLIKQTFLFYCMEKPGFACSKHSGFLQSDGDGVEFFVLTEFLLHEADQSLLFT